MSAILLIMKEKQLVKSFRNEIAVIIVYIRNQYLSTKEKTPLDKSNKEFLDVINL